MTEINVEEILDRDFLQFLSLSKTYYVQIPDEKDKLLCMQWLSKLCGEKVQGTSQKRNRNTYLLHLILNMQEGKMTGPFIKSPNDLPLSPAKTIFPMQESNNIIQMDTIIRQMPEDYEEKSADGRTYVAIRTLPNNQGAIAFVALNLDNEDADPADMTVYPCVADKSKVKHLKVLRDISKTTLLGENPSESQMEDFYVKTIDAKVSGDISQLYESLRIPKKKTCGREKNEMEFYDVLLKQIDDEIKGVTSGENDLVKFLVSRLAQDLRAVPKMKHIFKLNAAQQNLKLLEILRQKLVVRTQEAKRRMLLAEMEEQMLSSSAVAECCGNRLDQASEFMWQLAITKPLTDNDFDRLFDFYPEEAISTFLDLLANDRQVILNKGKERQHKMLESMRSEVYKEVQLGKAAYNKSREAYREWNEILSIVEEMLYEAGNEVMEGQHDITQSNEGVLMNMITEMKEIENLVIEEARRGEILTEKIVDANMWTFFTHDNEGKDVSWEIKSLIDDMRRESEAYTILISKQEERIKQLQKELSYVRQ